MKSGVKIVGKTNLAAVLLMTFVYLGVVLLFGVGMIVVAAMMILGKHGDDLPYWAALIIALVLGPMGVVLLKMMWRWPFVFMREYSFDGETLIYRTLWQRVFRSKSIDSIHKIMTIDDSSDRAVFPMIIFYDGSMVSLGDAFRRGSREAELLAAIVAAFPPIGDHPRSVDELRD